MRALLYDQHGAVIALALVVLMVVAVEIGYRVATRTRKTASESSISEIKTIQASLLGLLALLLGFTFSIALDRYNNQSVAVVEEANAIGTTFLRAEFLPVSVRADVRSALKQYIQIRVKSSELALNDHEHLAIADRDTVKLQDEIWAYTVKAVKEEPNPVITGLFVQSLNETIDAYGARTAELNRHVPELVLVMLYVSFLITGSIIGYVAGLTGGRPAHATYVMTLLFILLMAMITELDRPRRGMIQVSQQSLIELQEAMLKSN